jgi:anaerobic magnesium-protoporphyrin IX monomethyl ester cyclase
LKVLFVNVIDQENAVHKRYYPLAFGYLTSYCCKYGADFEPCYVEGLSENILRVLQPDVVALTSITENYCLAQSYAKLVKEFNSRIKVVIGGVHISAVPDSLSSSMDVGIVGEGEQTFLELVKADFEPEDSIKGLVYWNDCRLHKTEKRPLIEPLDAIPHPARSLFDSEPRQQYLFTSRGCSYRCRFCSSSRFWNKVRFHSPEYVAAEIMQIKAMGCSNICIYDDTFVLDVNRVKKIAELVEGSGLTFNVAARANLITDDIVITLKGMGVTAVGVGFESNSQRILDWLQKGNTVKDNQRAVDILRKHKLHFHCSFIRGIPIETKEDLKSTFKFITKNQLSYDMYWLMRFPNTPLYQGSTDWNACKVRYSKIPMSYRLQRRFKRLMASLKPEAQTKGSSEVTPKLLLPKVMNIKETEMHLIPKNGAALEEEPLEQRLKDE